MANIYVIQPAFTTGEISPAVGSRVDLDQYKSALLNAENTVIRPYGGCYRRQGAKYILANSKAALRTLSSLVFTILKLTRTSWKLASNTSGFGKMAPIRA